MTPDLQHALRRHTQWFGSYKKSGELKKIHVWLTVHQGQIEFLTPGDSPASPASTGATGKSIP